MKKTLLIAAIVAAGITFAMADDGQPAGRLYKIGEHTVEIDADCMILALPYGTDLSTHLACPGEQLSCMSHYRGVSLDIENYCTSRSIIDHH
ncbi:hypothetical protein C9421_29760 [Klebsiella pneumoniae]|nr:hypothetical protein C9421_29760 [Klebsiella pneumoniae]